MTKVDVTVINKAFKGIPVGGSTSVSAKDARILVALKRVAMSGAAPTYQTRMMTAETPAQVVAPAVEPAPEPADPAVFVTEPGEPSAERVKRQYIRRRPFDTPADDAQAE